jgi:hypothetical protein
MPQEYSEDDIRLYTGGRVGFDPRGPIRAKGHMDLRINFPGTRCPQSALQGLCTAQSGACGELGYQIVLSGHTDREGAVRNVAQGLLAQVSFDEPNALGTVDDVNSFCHFLSPYCLM